MLLHKKHKKCLSKVYFSAGLLRHQGNFSVEPQRGAQPQTIVPQGANFKLEHKDAWSATMQKKMLLNNICLIFAIVFLVFPQDISKDNSFEIVVDVSFKGKGAFIDDVGSKEIHLKNAKSQIVSLDKIGELSLDIAIFIDASASLIPRHDLTFQFISHLIESLRLRTIDAASLISFNYSIDVVQSPTSDKNLLIQRAESIKLGGDTKLLDAIFYAGGYFAKNRHSRQAVIIVTDGNDVGSAIRARQAYEKLSENNIRLYMFIMNQSLNFGPNDRDAIALHKRNVEKTGGKAFSVTDLKTAQKQIDQMMDELNHLERLTFRTGEKIDGNLDISVTRKGVRAIYPSAIKKKINIDLRNWLR
jgi:Mg-chelatase subunit ChlD